MTSVRKHIYLSLFIITLFVPCFTEAGRGIGVRPVSPASTEVRGNQWLFVIGIDTYIDWPRLKTAVSDAKAVRDILLSRYYFNENYVIELYDEQATRKNILKNLRHLAKNVRDDDSLVIFYAGHGHLDPITKAGSWIPVESGTKDVSAWISNHDIKNYLRVDAIKAKHILLISDSCFSGDFFRGHRGKLPEVTDEVIKRAYELTSRQAITSGGLEPVSDEGFGRNSVFSHFLVKTLKENEKPFLVPSDFFPDIKTGVAENAEQFPRLGSLTGTGGQQGGELVLFLKQDLRLKALSGQVSERVKELERLQQMEAAADEARKKETDEIARRERELAELDAKVEEMRKRLGTQAVRTDDSLDSMLAMVQQKEQQEKKLQELRRQREKEERKRQAEIARLKREREEKIIAMLAPEVQKYKKIVASTYGQHMKSEAWKSLIAKCPVGWADRLEVGDTKRIFYPPETRWMKGSLFVDTGRARNPKIKIMDSEIAFYQGISLDPGEYRVQVKDKKFGEAYVGAEILPGEAERIAIWQYVDNIRESFKFKKRGELWFPDYTFEKGDKVVFTVEFSSVLHGKEVLRPGEYTRTITSIGAPPFKGLGNSRAKIVVTKSAKKGLPYIERYTFNKKGDIWSPDHVFRKGDQVHLSVEYNPLKWVHRDQEEVLKPGEYSEIVDNNGRLTFKGVSNKNAQVSILPQQ